jgi:hypothetical protein
VEINKYFGGIKMKRISTSFPTWMVIFVLAVFLFAVNSPSMAQNHDGEGGEIEETLRQLTQQAATGYLQPIITPIGVDLNGGWFHRAPPAKMFGLSLEFGIVGMATTIPVDVSRTFSVTDTTFSFSADQARSLVTDAGFVWDDGGVGAAFFDQIMDQNFSVSIDGPNIMGASDEDIEIDFSGADVTFTDPGTGLPRTETVGADTWALGIGGLDFLEDLSFVPLAAPQLSVGTVLGTRATIRYIPTINLSSIPGASLFLDEDFGNISFFGFGLQHNPGVFLPNPLPLDVAIAFYTQTFKIGEEFFKVKTTAWGLNASKQLGIGPINITPYAGIMFETSTVDIVYTYELGDLLGTPQEIDLPLHFEGENKRRITLGLSVKLLLFNINADYNIGKWNSYTVGFMFSM